MVPARAGAATRRRPSLLASAKSALKRVVYNATPTQVVSSPIFWVMYLMFVMMAAGGLMATAQLGPIAKDFGLHDSPVSLLGLTLPALTFALTIDRVLNGLTRPFFGWISDRIGRENTMFLAFAIEAVGILALSKYGHSPVAFVVLTGIVFFAWGEIYSLFPATCGDTYGPKFAATNAGPVVHGEGHGRVAGAVHERDHGDNRQLACGLHGLRRVWRPLPRCSRYSCSSRCAAHMPRGTRALRPKAFIAAAH